MLDTTKEALANAPHFKSSEWPSLDNEDYAQNVYHSYNVQPYWSSAASDNTAQNVQDRSGNSITPLNQGTSQADVETTREIRKEVMAAQGLSVDARNVKIITVDGKVTLRGTVATEEEKRTIEDIAVKVASRANVDDQLTVEATTKTSSLQ